MKGLKTMARPPMNRVGETRTMKNGMNATILVYRKSDDIDIQFEDGVIMEHVRYQGFCRGSIAHTVQDFSTCINETKKIGKTA